MGVEPFRGREFSADEVRVNGAPAMIVSYGYWQQYLGGRADFSWAHLSMDGKTYSVVGVMPQGFDFRHRKCRRLGAARTLRMVYQPLVSQRGRHRASS